MIRYFIFFAIFIITSFSRPLKATNSIAKDSLIQVLENKIKQYNFQKKKAIGYSPKANEKIPIEKCLKF